MSYKFWFRHLGKVWRLGAGKLVGYKVLLFYIITECHAAPSAAAQFQK
jgi:hypothetical protein